MPNPDSKEDQRLMADALIEAFPEDDYDATEVARETGLSDDTIRRWWRKGVSLPLREPVKSSLYRWYTGQQTPSPRLSIPPADPRDGDDRYPYELLDEIMALIRDRPDQVDLNDVMIDYALAQRSIASRIRAEALRQEAANAGTESALLRSRVSERDGTAVADRVRDRELQEGRSAPTGGD